MRIAELQNVKRAIRFGKGGEKGRERVGVFQTEVIRGNHRADFLLGFGSGGGGKGRAGGAFHHRLLCRNSPQSGPGCGPRRSRHHQRERKRAKLHWCFP